MNRRFLGVVWSLAMLTLAACSSTNAANTTTTNSPTTAPVAKASPSAAVTPTTVDPCQLVTQSEASQLAGTTYATSKEETTSGGAKLCWYGANTLNVFEVEVATFSSASDAQSAWDTEKSKVIAQLQKEAAAPGVTINVNVQDTSLSGADRAADGTFNGNLGGHTFAGTALYFLKGVYFVAIVDLVVDHAAPAISAIEAQGSTTLGRLP